MQVNKFPDIGNQLKHAITFPDIGNHLKLRSSIKLPDIVNQTNREQLNKLPRYYYSFRHHMQINKFTGI